MMKKNYFRISVIAVTLCAALGLSVPVSASDQTNDSGDDDLVMENNGLLPVYPEAETAAETAAPSEDTAPLIEDDGTAYEIDNSDYSYAEQISEADAAAVAKGDEQLSSAASEVASFAASSAILLPVSDEEQVAAWLEELTKSADPTGSDEEQAAASYIESEMTAMGYTVATQNFHEGFLNKDLIDIPGVNLVAERGADSSVRSDQILIVAAHYDSKTDPEEDDPLANDKSGAVTLLETARILSSMTSDIDLCFVFFSGEEDGNYGSARFIEQLSEDYRSRIVGVICLGPVGYTTQRISDAQEADASEETGLQSDSSDASGSTSSVLDTLRAVAETSAAEEDQRQRLTYLLGVDNPKGDSMANLIYGSVSYYESIKQPVPGYSDSDFSVVPDQAGMRANFSDSSIKAVSLFQNLDGLYTQDPVTLTWSSPAAAEEETEGETKPDGNVFDPTSEDVPAQGEAETESEVPGEAGFFSGEDLHADPAQIASLADCLALVCDMYMQSAAM